METFSGDAKGSKACSSLVRTSMKQANPNKRPLLSKNKKSKSKNVANHLYQFLMLWIALHDLKHDKIGVVEKPKGRENILK